MNRQRPIFLPSLKFFLITGNLLASLTCTSVTLSQPDTLDPAWVKHYQSELLPGNDDATDIAVDRQGNIYVTGSSDRSPFGTDYLTIKYSPAGDTLWTRRYDGPGQGDDRASVLAVDASDNVYVTGSSIGSDGNSDYATIKYDMSGNQLWIARYNGLGDSTDTATALAVDGSGNVHVTGGSHGSGTLEDFVTIKYATNGTVLWEARYNGEGNSSDNAAALSLDEFGNVIVVGSSQGDGTFNDFTTVKYDAGGTQLWVARYDGPSNDSDEATALAVDASGNAYVTGSSIGSGGYDYATIKYDAGGNQLWISRYNGSGNASDNAIAIGVDSSGRAYVTGTSVGSTGYDFTTIKYDSDGTQLWSARYNGPGNYSDYAASLLLDDSANVYVAGLSRTGYYDYATIKYDTEGNPLWVAAYDGPASEEDEAAALAIDESGNVYVTGLSEGVPDYSDYATVKYDASGNQVWAARFNGSGNGLDWAAALGVDGSGNVYITGYSYGSMGFEDYATVGYDATGAQLWTARYNGPGSASDVATALVVDGSGDVIVTGWSQSQNFDRDCATIKYDADGNQLWVSRYNHLSADDEATALAVDGSGNVYVTGSSNGFGDFDYVTIKYDAAGNQLWATRYNGTGQWTDIVKALAVDGSGNVYVTGWSYGLPSADYATIKYDAMGNELWAARYDGTGKWTDEAADLAVDGSGNVYVTGSSLGLTGFSDFVTVKYDAGGNQLWATAYNGPEGDSDAATALAVDGSGNVYVTGWSFGSGTSIDYATIKYDENGNQLWAARYSGPGGKEDEAIALSVDATGSVYITGSSDAMTTADDCVTMKYDTDGNLLWVARYDGPGNSIDNSAALGLDGTGNVFVAGRSSSGGWSAYATIKYVQDPLAVKDVDGTPHQWSLENNYPNPFNPTTTLLFNLGSSAFANLSIYDILGRRVATLVNEKLPPGLHVRQWNAIGVPSGVYFYRLQAGGFTETRKLVLLR